MTTRDVLERVLHIFEEHDWGQGEYCDSATGVPGNEEFSLDGAILHVVEFHDQEEKLAEQVASQLLAAIGFSDSSILDEDRMTTLARWNDERERTKAEVVKAINDTLSSSAH